MPQDWFDRTAATTQAAERAAKERLQRGGVRGPTQIRATPPPSWSSRILEWITGAPADPMREVGPMEAVTTLGGLVPGGRVAGAGLRAGKEVGETVIDTAMAAGRAGNEALAATRSGGITAFHASPHNFDKFDISKVGTGQGAQAYSHGLYFGGKEEVADQYFKEFTKPTVEIGGVPRAVPYWSPVLDPEPRLIRRLADKRARFPRADERAIVDHVRADLHRELSERAEPGGAGAIRRLKDELSWLELAERDGLRTHPGAHMYEVNLQVDPAELLDWDTPLSQQSPEVIEAMERMLATNPRAARSLRAQGDFLKRDPSGGAAYRALQGGDAMLGAQQRSAEITQQLREAGIPGLRYLDQGSRGLPDPKHAQGVLDHWRQELATTEANIAQGNRRNTYDTEWLKDQIREAQNELRAALRRTHNYVMYEDSLIDIYRKYGLLPPAALAGSAAARQRQRPQNQVGTPPPVPGVLGPPQ